MTVDDLVDVIDAAFVDGECVVVLANSPALLDTAIDKPSNIISRTFELLYLEMNWKEGGGGNQTAR